MKRQGFAKARGRFLGRIVLFFAAALGINGCILVSAVDHQIRVNGNGSGVAVITFLDLRSDGLDDSTYFDDMNVLLDLLGREEIEEFEKDGKEILKKEFLLSGDTLSLRVEYEFKNLQTIEGVRETNEEIFFVVNESRQIVRTNGNIKGDPSGGKRMVWQTGSRFLSYLVKDAIPPKGRSLAQAYRLHLQQSGSRQN
ncbi:MAG TPA: hypothetical protein VIH68_04785 [Bacteroidota bacterium]